ncbi:NifB/NifX family molybdenum-iron cluster-binding protein [candidate division KSB1 bacterium]|nr:NifB/NifX family molybdenum-iron cluster-binding protein [candidate division KSB1 bacterium]
MKIAVTATGGSLSAQMDERFGRCAYFIFVDSATLRFTAISNPASTTSSGAGPAAAREIAKHGATVLITGNVGVNAQQALTAAGIKVVTSAGGTVKAVVERYLQQS